MQRVLSSVTLLGLLVATAAAFAITEHLKLIKSPVFGTLVSVDGRTVGPKVISPVCGCPTSTATIHFKLRHESRVTVRIVDSSGNRVATLASNELLRPRSPQHRSWDGHTADGAVAPDGVYYPLIHLPHRAFQLTNRIVLDSTPPKVLAASPVKRRPILFAGPGRSVAIRYSFNERAHPVVYLGRRLIVFGHTTKKQDKVKWAGRLGGRPVPAGTYVLSVGAQDLAGNETGPAARTNVPVVVRYVVLDPTRVTVRAGRPLRVHVKTAAARYTWRLGKRHGASRRRLLRLHAPTTPGTYRLVVSADGQSTTAVVRVRPR